MGQAAKLEIYRKLLREMGLVEKVCQAAASILVELVAVLQPSESIDEPIANIFVDSVRYNSHLYFIYADETRKAILFSITHDPGRGRRFHNTSVVAARI